jgi:H+/Cl- antiporter ClcA
MSRNIQVLICLGIGSIVAFVLFYVTDGSSTSRFFPLLCPGALLADAVSQGANDALGIVLYVFGNVAFYSVSSFVVLILVRSFRA